MRYSMLYAHELREDLGEFGSWVPCVALSPYSHTYATSPPRSDRILERRPVMQQRYHDWCTPSASAWQLRVVSRPEKQEAAQREVAQAGPPGGSPERQRNRDWS